MSDAGLALCTVAMAIGLIGILVPLLPGVLLIWSTALAYGLVAGFGIAGRVAFGVITLLAAASIYIKLAVPHRRGRASGAPTKSLAIGALVAVVGFFVVPVVGLPIGAVVGVLAAEYVRTGDRHSAWRSTKGVIRGFGVAAALELGIGVVMIASWAAWVLASR